ncbi:MAG: polyphosphate kinase 2 family protein [Bacteroidota bacterium]
MSESKLNTALFKVNPGTIISLDSFDTDLKEGISDKKEAQKKLKADTDILQKLQYRLYAENKQSLLIVFQAMDAGGKDSAIKHVFRGVNAQGCKVHSFKTPTVNELEHDFLWRHYTRIPARGDIGIFNRSHYENVLITKVHPEYILKERLKGINTVEDITEDFWEKRYEHINAFEKTVAENGTTILKFFLHLSKEKQKKRFLKRIDNEEKNWKFSSDDVKERAFWDDYQQAYEKAINKTSTDHAPWHIVPADTKWYTRIVLMQIIIETLNRMDIRLPELSKEQKDKLGEYREKLDVST